MKKPWAGRFKERTDRLVEEFTASIGFDSRLYRYDIIGSIAHARMLAKVGIITDEEASKIIKGLEEIKGEIKKGEFELSTELEDIHMNIEKRLIDKIGETGARLHTGRSRNDQIALDLRLYLRDEIGEIIASLKENIKTLLVLARENIDVIMPGYTHLQRAQPVLFSHHILAYATMLKRDMDRYRECLKRVNVMPLGSGALSGSTLPLDREYLAELLDFPEISSNSMDAVSDRDFCIEFISVSSILMMHLSRMAEEIILWSTEEFGFVELSDAFTTGSSMMPQKKNPDVAELIRGKTGRVYGSLLNLLTLMKGLPLTYNRDMQEDKPPLFDTVDTVKSCLSILKPLLSSMSLNRERLRDAVKGGFIEATDMAEYLVEKGVPFRMAHEIVGRAVAYAIEKGKGLRELTIEEWRQFSKDVGEEIASLLTPEKMVERRMTKGGTSPESVKDQIDTVEKEVFGDTTSA